MAPVRLFLAAQEPILSAASAKYGSVWEGTVGNSITVQLESIAR